MFFFGTTTVALAASLCSMVWTAALIPPRVDLHTRSPASASTAMTGSLMQPINSTELIPPLPLLLGSDNEEWTQYVFFLSKF